MPEETPTISATQTPVQPTSENKNNDPMEMLKLMFGDGRYLLILRGCFIIFWLTTKTHILARKSPDLIATYSGLGAIEGVLGIYLYENLHAIPALISAKLKELENAPEEIGTLFRRCIAFSLTLMPQTLLICLLAPRILALFDQPAMIAQGSVRYFNIMFFTYLFDVLYRTTARYMIGLSKQRAVFLPEVIEGSLDLIFAYKFVNDYEMGVAGVATSFAFASLLTFTGFSCYLSCRGDLESYKLFAPKKNDLLLSEITPIMYSGFTLSMTSVIEYCAQTVMNIYCGLSKNKINLIALQAAKSYSLVQYPIFGFATTCIVLIADRLSKKCDSYKMIGNISIAACMTFTLVCALLAMVFSKHYANLFLDCEKNDCSTVIQFVRTQSIIEVINAAKIMGTNVLLACGNTTFPIFSNLLFLFILNVMLMSYSQYVAKNDEITTFSLQIAGYFFSAAAIFLKWYAETNRDSAVNRFFERCSALFFLTKRTVNNVGAEMESRPAIITGTPPHPVLEMPA